MIFLDRLTLKGCLKIFSYMKGEKPLTKTIQILDPIQKDFHSKFLLYGMKLMGFNITEAEFYAGKLRSANNENLWTSSEQKLKGVAFHAANNCLSKNPLFNQLNEEWNRNTILLYLAKYFVSIARYGRNNTVMKIMIADSIANQCNQKQSCLFINTNGIPLDALEKINYDIKIIIYESFYSNIKIINLFFHILPSKRLVCLVYACIFVLKSTYDCLIKFYLKSTSCGDRSQPSILLSQEDNISLDRSYRGQPHWLFEKDEIPKYRIIILKNSFFENNDSNSSKLKNLNIYLIEKSFLNIFNFSNKNISKLRNSLFQLVFNSFTCEGSMLGASLHLTRLFLTGMNISLICDQLNVKAYMTCESYFIEADAMNLLGPEKGIHTFSYQYSNMSIVSPLLMTTADTLFVFSDLFKDRWNNTEVKPHNITTVGYIYDSSINLIRKRIDLDFQDFQSECFKIGYFDESVQKNNDKYGIISEKDHLNEIMMLVDFMEKDESVKILVKSQFMRNCPSRLYPNQKKLIDLINLGRFIELKKGVHRNIVLPAEAAMLSDILISHLIGATAGLEAAVAGKRCVLIDPYNVKSHNDSIYSKGNILYSNMQSALDAIKRYKNGDHEYENVGDWSQIINQFDPFRDGKSARRIRSKIEEVVSNKF